MASGRASRSRGPHLQNAGGAVKGSCACRLPSKGGWPRGNYPPRTIPKRQTPQPRLRRLRSSPFVRSREVGQADFGGRAKERERTGEGAKERKRWPKKRNSESAKQSGGVWSLRGPRGCPLAILSVRSSPTQLRHRAADGSVGALQTVSLREYPMCSSGDATRDLRRLVGCQVSLPRGTGATAETEKRGQSAHGRGPAVDWRPRMLCPRSVMRSRAACQEPFRLEAELHAISVPGRSCS